MRKCLICGIKLSARQKKLCSKLCYGTYLRLNPSKRNGFKPGTKPWNKGLLGYQGGDKHYNWKGGKHTDSRGYVHQFDPNKLGKSHGKREYEHRLIVEKSLGRKLRKGETIHHINENTSDNRLKNLYLFKTDSAHRLYHRWYKNKRLKSNLC